MRRILTIFVICFSCIQILYAQEVSKKVIPIISAEYDFLSYQNYNDLIKLNHYSISGGVQLFEKLNISANAGFLHTQHLIDGQNKKINTVPLLLCLQYRFFKDFWVSPSIRFDVGGIIYSNVKNQYVNSRLEIEPDMGDWGEWNSVFKNWGGYIAPQVAISFKIKNLYLDLGVGYSILNYHIFNPNSSSNEKINVSGIQLKTGVTYRFKN